MVRISGIAALLLVLGAGFLSACNPGQAVPSERVSLALNQSARLASDVTVRVDSINDSRCPEDVQCIWGGMAGATLTLSKNADAQTVNLRLGHRNQTINGVTYTDSTGVTFGLNRYKVILRDVVPYPSRKTASQPKEALIQVSRL